MCRHDPMANHCPLCDLEMAESMNRGKETVFKGQGNSHFSHVEGNGFHVTTEVPKLKQGIRVAIHDKTDY